MEVTVVMAKAFAKIGVLNTDGSVVKSTEVAANGNIVAEAICETLLTLGQYREIVELLSFYGDKELSRQVRMGLYHLGLGGKLYIKVEDHSA